MGPSLPWNGPAAAWISRQCVLYSFCSAERCLILKCGILRLVPPFPPGAPPFPPNGIPPGGPPFPPPNFGGPGGPPPHLGGLPPPGAQGPPVNGPPPPGGPPVPPGPSVPPGPGGMHPDRLRMMSSK
jgi:hypothetical protein